MRLAPPLHMIIRMTSTQYSQTPAVWPAVLVTVIALVATYFAVEAELSILSYALIALFFGWAVWLLSRRIDLALDDDSLTATLGRRTRTIPYSQIKSVEEGKRPKFHNYSKITWHNRKPMRFDDADTFTLGGNTVRICVDGDEDCIVAVRDRDRAITEINERIRPLGGSSQAVTA